MVYELERMDGQHVLITGGLGFIGSNLAKTCHHLGATVAIFTKTLSKEINIADIKDAVTIIQGDITSYEDVERAVRDKDIVFHLAAQTSHIVAMQEPLLDVNINLVGTMNILEACRKHNPNAKIISAGSVTEVGIAKERPISETTKENPIELYAANKLIAEKYLHIYHTVHGLYTCTIRFGTIFGDRQQLTNPKRGITNFFIGNIMKDKEITVYGDGTFRRDYNYIGNVVDALILTTQQEKANGETFLIGCENMQFIDMVRGVVSAVETVTGKKGTISFVPFPEEQKKIDVGDTEIDYSHIRNTIGWEPKINFKEGVERTVQSYTDKFDQYL